MTPPQERPEAAIPPIRTTPAQAPAAVLDLVSKSRRTWWAVLERELSTRQVLTVLACLLAACSAWLVTSNAQAKVRHEEQLLYSGTEIRDAIAAYYFAAPPGERVLPSGLDDLLDDRRGGAHRRHLSRLMPDPVTGARDWIIVWTPDHRMAGVHSASESEPVARHVFDPDAVEVGGTHRYSQWVFRFDPGRFAGIEANLAAARSAGPASAEAPLRLRGSATLSDPVAKRDAAPNARLAGRGEQTAPANADDARLHIVRVPPLRADILHSEITEKVQPQLALSRSAEGVSVTAAASKAQGVKEPGTKAADAPPVRVAVLAPADAGAREAPAPAFAVLSPDDVADLQGSGAPGSALGGAPAGSPTTPAADAVLGSEPQTVPSAAPSTPAAAIVVSPAPAARTDDGPAVPAGASRPPEPVDSRRPAAAMPVAVSWCGSLESSWRDACDAVEQGGDVAGATACRQRARARVAQCSHGAPATIEAAAGGHTPPAKADTRSGPARTAPAAEPMPGDAPVDSVVLTNADLPAAQPDAASAQVAALPPTGVQPSASDAEATGVSLERRFARGRRGAVAVEAPSLVTDPAPPTAEVALLPPTDPSVAIAPGPVTDEGRPAPQSAPPVPNGGIPPPGSTRGWAMPPSNAAPIQAADAGDAALQARVGACNALFESDRAVCAAELNTKGIEAASACVQNMNVRQDQCHSGEALGNLLAQ